MMKKHALEYARQGFAVFPVQSPADAERLRAELAKADLDEDERGKREKKIGEKKPFPGTRGVHEATTDEAKIKKRWTEWPEANIAWCPAMSLGGTVVVDVDVDKGDGNGSYNPEHLDALKLPRTDMAIRTPSGGLHLVYALKEGELLPPSQSTVGHKIDIRCKGSYGLLPGSKGPNGTEYTWKSRGDPAFRSDALVEAAGKARERDPKAEVWLIEPDLPENVAEAEQWAKTKARTGTCGVDGNQTLAATGAMMHGFGLSEDRAMTVLLEHWNPRCEPPWSEDELRRHGGSGWRSATNPPGNLTKAYRVASRGNVTQLFSKTAAETAETAETAESADFVEDGVYRAGRLTLTFRRAFRPSPEPEWLIREVMPTNVVAMMTGESKSFKSFLALDMALSIANGGGKGNSPRWGDDRIVRSGPVIYIAGEGKRGLETRVKGWEIEHNGGQPVNDFALVSPSVLLSEGLKDWWPLLKQAEHEFSGPPLLIVLDTVSRAMVGVNDSAQENASLMIDMAQEMASKHEETSALMVHHLNKEGSSARGSGVFINEPEVRYEVERRGMQGTSGRDYLVNMNVAKLKDWKDDVDFGTHLYNIFDPVNTLVPYEWMRSQGELNLEEHKKARGTEPSGRRVDHGFTPVGSLPMPGEV